MVLKNSCGADSQCIMKYNIEKKLVLSNAYLDFGGNSEIEECHMTCLKARGHSQGSRNRLGYDQVHTQYKLEENFHVAVAKGKREHITQLGKGADPSYYRAAYNAKISKIIG